MLARDFRVPVGLSLRVALRLDYLAVAVVGSEHNHSAVRAVGLRLHDIRAGVLALDRAVNRDYLTHFDFTRGGGNRVFLVIFVDFFDKVVCAHRFEVLERVFVGLFTSGANDVQFFRHFVVQYRFVFEVLVGNGKKRYAYESDDKHYEYGL